MRFLTNPAWNRVKPFNIYTQVCPQLHQSFFDYFSHFCLLLLFLFVQIFPPFSHFFLYETNFICILNSYVSPHDCHLFILLICAWTYTLLPIFQATNLSLASAIFSFCLTQNFLVKKVCNFVVQIYIYICAPLESLSVYILLIICIYI